MPPKGGTVGAVWGRDAELALASGVLAPELSDPVVLVLRGEEGIGKTTLWKAVLSMAEDRGYRVLSARPVGSEATFAFVAVADLLRDGLEEALPSLPAPQRAALEAALLRGDLEGSPDPRAIAFGFSGCLRALARSGPVVVGVDDVQSLDAPSARVLAFALRRLEGVPVAVVLASRAPADATDPTPLGLDDGALGERIHRIAVGPLDLEGVRQILLSRLDARFPHWVLVRMHEASGGNPFFALELGRALVRRGIDLLPGQALPMPGRLAELLSERLAGLSEPVCRMLLLVSTSARPTLSSIAAALGDPPDLEEIVETAVRGDVIEVAGDRVRFSNPLLGTAVYAEASPEARRRAHRMLADVAADPEERARHLALAAEGPDEGIAQALEDAARHARSHGAPDAAAQLAELARSLTPPERSDGRARRTAQAGRYAFESAEIERAEELLEEAAAASTGSARAEALLYLSRVHYHQRDAASAAALAEQALHEASEDPSLQASINLELAAAAELSGDHRSAIDRARRALELAERSRDRTITAESLAVSSFYGFLSGQGFPAAEIERAKSLQGPGPPVRPLRSPAFYEACILMWSDELQGARDRLRELERRARDAGDEGSLSVLLSLLSQIDGWAGDWTEAARLAEGSRALAGWTGQPIYLSLALYAAALVAGLKGDADGAFALAGESLDLAEQTGSVQTGEYARSVLGAVELSRGDARAADRWLSGLVEAMQERGDADPGTVRFVPDEVEALIGLDEAGRAEALLSPFERRAEALGRSWALGSSARCRGLALASRRQLDDALRAFDRALEHQRPLGQPLELGRTYLARGSALRRGKKWASARESLGRALGIFEGLGAALWAERTGAELARIGGRSPGRTALTETETRVAELAATGLTNREVAARLFVSVSTVESNLRRAYRKLGVRSRAELSHRLARSGRPS
jgi:DNA-binding CsgD family transcriptional regulator